MLCLQLVVMPSSGQKSMNVALMYVVHTYCTESGISKITNFPTGSHTVTHARKWHVFIFNKYRWHKYRIMILNLI